ncbi:TPA: CHAP domain-containing protein, partial [Streptococcus pneumoniae]|nr:CHAP domain-containing protein [Streptococcus pneumoniae]HEV5829423.1 CHAP domain-containing protein [Streptococcus pneumoniae]HEV5870691.1 CHAP domain-containing protein [Streptococcus pneumoniae]HEV6118149.1 CHAP domain-containing protein [Streptococcus pneumoniae]HEV8759142.1 CHAP domain-containing protein [Streptococcus pneumoniae]
MTSDKQNVKVARKTFQSSLKASRIHYRREKKGLKRSLPKRRFIIRRAEKAETREQRQTLKQTYQEEKDLAPDTFTKAISYVSPRWLKVKDIRKYRLPQARHRLTVARKHLAEIKMAEKEQAINPKFTYQKEPNKKTPSRFHFQKEKSLDRLQAEKKVNSAKRDVKQLKRAHKAKKASTKVKRGLRYVASDSLDLVAQDDDLEGIRTVKDMSIKGRRYGRFIYQSGKLLVTSGQTGMRFTKTKIAHGKERYQNFKKGKGFTRQKPLKHKRRYHTFLKQARKHSVSGIKGVIQAIKGSLTFFSTIVLNPMTWVVSGLLFFLLLMMSFVVGISGTSLIQQDEGELTKAYTHMTWEDAENTRTNDTGITYYTKIDDVMGFMNLKYQDYALEEVMENGDKTYQVYLSQLWHDLNGGDSLKAMLELTKEPAYKLSDDDREELKELSKEGTYLALQELDNPFQEQTEDDTLTMTVRYGYEMIEDKPTLHHHIILEAKENQVIVAPMDGKVSLDGENLIITSGKGLNKSQLTLFNVHTGRVTDGQKVQAGEMIGQTKDGSGLKVTYQKVDDDSEKLVYVNPAFYFPKVIQLQTTILPTIGQFGGDEFARAKAIYEYLKSQGATNQAIAAILGNWSVESSINPKRAEGDYLSPPVGATDSSWDDEGWLSLNGPAIYNGRYPNILRRGLGLGQWTDTADGSRRHTLLLKYAKRQNQKWYDLDLQLDFMLHGDNPYYTNWL